MDYENNRDFLYHLKKTEGYLHRKKKFKNRGRPGASQGWFYCGYVNVKNTFKYVCSNAKWKQIDERKQNSFISTHMIVDQIIAPQDENPKLAKKGFGKSAVRLSDESDSKRRHQHSHLKTTSLYRHKRIVIPGTQPFNFVIISHPSLAKDLKKINDFNWCQKENFRFFSSPSKLQNVVNSSFLFVWNEMSKSLEETFQSRWNSFHWGINIKHCRAQYQQYLLQFPRAQKLSPSQRMNQRVVKFFQDSLDMCNTDSVSRQDLTTLIISCHDASNLSICFLLFFVWHRFQIPVGIALPIIQNTINWPLFSSPFSRHVYSHLLKLQQT